jgi:hypothetical protein
MKKKVVILLLLVSVGSVLAQAQTANQLTPEQKSWLSKANRREKNGWIYLHIEGVPKERGFQHGYLLAKEIKESLRILGEVWHYQTAMDWQWLVKEGGKLFIPAIDAENLGEINGMVEGMKTAGVESSREEMVAFNGYMELLWSWWPTVKDKISPNSPEPFRDGCSSFIATGSYTDNGEIVLAHNSWFGYYFPQFNLVVDILPEKGNHLIWQSSPGFIHSGSDFFVTSAGLVGAETTMADFFPFDPKGTPEFARMRHATQYATSIDQWCEMMKVGNNGGYANAWLIGDLHSNEIARLELGLNYIGFERKRDGYFAGANIAQDLKILRFETRTKETDIKMSGCARMVRWYQLLEGNKGKINIELAKEFLSDHYDTWLKKDYPASRSLCGHFELDPDIRTPGVEEPFTPWGSLDGKVLDSRLARQMSFAARFGSTCGMPFSSTVFLAEHPQFKWMTGLIKDRPTQPWTIFKAGETK